MNLGLALVLCVVYAVGVTGLAVVGTVLAAGTAPTISGALGTLLYGLVELPVLALIPVLVYLALGELTLPRIGRRRLASIVLGAAIPVAYVLALRTREFSTSPTAVASGLILAGAGAVYGAIARLPAPRSGA